MAIQKKKRVVCISEFVVGVWDGLDESKISRPEILSQSTPGHALQGEYKYLNIYSAFHLGDEQTFSVLLHHIASETEQVSAGSTFEYWWYGTAVVLLFVLCFLWVCAHCRLPQSLSVFLNMSFHPCVSGCNRYLTPAEGYDCFLSGGRARVLYLGWPGGGQG